MELVLQLSNEQAAPIALSDAVFALPFREALVHQAVVAYLSGGRSGTRAQKSRADVQGGGRKPWKQKGTGRARAGTIRSPIWRGGGRTFAARPQDHGQKLNRKMYRGALRSIFSELVRQERLHVVPELTLNLPKTRELYALLKREAWLDVLLVTVQESESLLRAASNLPAVEVCTAAQINPVSLIRHQKVVITAGALAKIEEHLQ